VEHRRTSARCRKDVERAGEGDRALVEHLEVAVHQVLDGIGVVVDAGDVPGLLEHR